MFLLGPFRQILPFEGGVHALDRQDDNLLTRGNRGRGEPLDVIELGELAVVVVGDERP